VAFGERTAGEIMTPRVRLAFALANEPLTAVIQRSRTTGHSRFPVVAGEADNVVGAVHVKHVVAVPRSERATTLVRDVMVGITEVPETLRLDPLMAQLRQEGFQVAVVLDEYGGTAGFVTLEDVVEEIVGDITDEHDALNADARRRPDGSWSVSGLLRPDEVRSQTGVPLPEHEDYDTVAGLLLRAAGRIPEVGDTVTVPLELELDPEGEPLPPRIATLAVERMAGLRIDRIRLATAVADPDGDTAGPRDGLERGTP
jgi:CBS domain containing-hemolysin-like protein